VWMHDGLLAAIVGLLRWQELAMTNLWWWGCGWECLVWMRDGLFRHSEIASLVGAYNDEPVVVGVRVGMPGVDA
jgi:hypothetical protein